MPKVNVTFDAQPFSVPNFVRMVPPTKSVCAPTATEVSPNEIAIPLGSLDPVTLDNLCSDFRREVFFKAGKTPPPTVDLKPRLSETDFTQLIEDIMRQTSVGMPSAMTLRQILQRYVNA